MISSYGPYSEPNVLTGSRFRYTGQILIPEVGLYHYKARAYSPFLGRFLQTDPVGYKDQVNLYAYVHNDPMNMTDPDGMKARVQVDEENRKIKVTVPIGRRINIPFSRIQRSVQSISQEVTDKQGNTWQVTFDASQGSMTDAKGSQFSVDVTRTQWPGNAGNYNIKTHAVELRKDSTDKTIAHEVGGHGSGLIKEHGDLYKAGGVPNPEYPGNLMNTDAPGSQPGFRLNWNQVQHITSEKSGNHIINGSEISPWVKIRDWLGM